MRGSLKLVLGLSAILAALAPWDISLEEEDELNEIGRTPTKQTLASWGLW
jgi:hypothetical protein